MKYASVLLAVTCLFSAVKAQYLETTLTLGLGEVSDVVWNPVDNKVYCSLRDENRVVVIDGATNGILRSIDVSSDPTVLMWNPIGDKVYCSCSEGRRVCVIDGAGDSLLCRIRTGRWPWTLTHDPTDNKVYVWCYDDDELDVIDGAGDSVLGALPIGYADGGFVWHPVSNMLFCPNPDRDSILVVDCRTDSLRMVVYGGDGPYGGCYNRVNQLAYYACYSGQQVRAFSATGESTVAIVEYVPASILCFAPCPNKLVAAAGLNPGALTIIDCDSHSIRASLDPGRVVDLVCDSVNARVYGAGYDDDRVVVIDALADSIIKVIPLNGPPHLQPSALAWNSTNSRVYVGCRIYGTVAVIKDAAGIEEGPKLQASSSRLAATVVRGLPAGAVAFDAMGRRVANAKPGVYFVVTPHPDPLPQGERGNRVRKVVIQH